VEVADVVDLVRQALIVTVLLCAPALLAGLLIGLVMGLVQALTQIQEQTVAFVPKLLVVTVVIVLTLPWSLELLINYTRDLYLGMTVPFGG
jgi:flagellar biosynthetic protein FliQ